MIETARAEELNTTQGDVSIKAKTEAGTMKGIRIYGLITDPIDVSVTELSDLNDILEPMLLEVEASLIRTAP